MSGGAKRYRAFISYSQKDKRHATRLHKALEAYRIPKGVEAASVDPKTRKLGRIFRDEEEMSAATDLGAALRGAIADSESLIVICSPCAAQSKWVDEEVLHFKRSGRAQSIFAVIVDGKPNSGDRETECFPPALRFALDPDGGLTDTPAEPLGLDLRKEPIARLRARLVAGLLGVSFDDLWRRGQRRARARTATWTSGAIAGTVLIGGVIKYTQEQAGVERLAERADRIAQHSRDIRKTTDFHDEAILLALYAHATVKQSWVDRLMSRESKYVSARNALISALTHNRLKQIYSGHSDDVHGVDISERLNAVVSGSDDGTVRIWDRQSGEQQHLLDATGESNGAAARGQAPGDVTDTRFSAGGNRVISAARNGTVRVWDADSGQLVFDTRVRRAAFAAALNEAGDTAFVGQTDPAFLTYSIESPAEVRALNGHENAIYSIALNADETLALTGSRQGEIVLWDSVRGTFVRTLEGPPDNVLALAFASQNNYAAAGSILGQIKIFDLTSGSELTVLDNTAPSDDSDTQSSVVSLHFDSFDRRVYAAALDKQVQIWNLSTGLVDDVLVSSRDHILDIALSHDDREIVVGGSGGHLRSYALGPLHEPGALVDDRPGAVLALAIDDADRLFLGGGVFPDTEGTFDAELRSAQTLTLDTALAGHTLAIADVDVTGDGAYGLTGSFDGSFIYWDLTAGEALQRVGLSHGTPRGLAFGPAGTTALIGSSQGHLSYWNLVDATVIKEFPQHGEEINAVAISPDGALAASASDASQFINIFDLENGTLRTVLIGHDDDVLDVQFSADGAYLLSGSKDRTAKVWDLAQDEAIITLTDHTGFVSSVAFDPADPDRVGTGSFDGTVKVWDLRTGDALVTFDGHDDWVRAIAFTRNGQHVISASRDGAITRWDLPTVLTMTDDDLVSVACDTLKQSNARTAFEVSDVQRYQALAEERHELAEPARLRSPCE